MDENVFDLENRLMVYSEPVDNPVHDASQVNVVEHFGIGEGTVKGGVVLLDQLCLLHRCEAGLELRVGLKPFLRAT